MRRLHSPASSRSPWLWVPTLYIAKGLPYMVIMMLSLLVFKRLGMGTAAITFHTSSLLLPWVLKPLWRPFVDLNFTRRAWILFTELLTTLLLAGIAWSVTEKSSWPGTVLLLFWLMAFSSATHDMVIVSFFRLRISEDDQERFVYVRRLFFRLTMTIILGVLVMVAGNLEVITRNIRYSWSVVFYVLAGLSLLLLIYNFFALPKAVERTPRGRNTSLAKLRRVFHSNLQTFVHKEHAASAVMFLLLYVVIEGLVAKVSILFLVDRGSIGGLGLSPQEFAYVQGTIGFLSLVGGGVAGNYALRQYGFRRCLFPMAAALTLPKLVFVYLSFDMPESLLPISLCVIVEQAGYGFGMTSYFRYLSMVSRGHRSAAHYGMGVAVMSFSLMVTGIFSGLWVHIFGYRKFFVLMMLSSVLTFAVTYRIHADADCDGEKS